jgi:preprotein translocase subunit SecG
MTSILFFVQAGLVVMIVIAVLLQKSSSIGLGAYSGTNESVFGAKGPAGFLTKVTFVLGFLFLVNTITLGYLYAQQKNDSVTDALVDKNSIVAPTINVVSDINTTK